MAENKLEPDQLAALNSDGIEIPYAPYIVLGSLALILILTTCMCI